MNDEFRGPDGLTAASDISRELERAKRANMPQMLFKCSRLVNERAIELAKVRLGLPKLRVSHTTLLPHIDLDGTRQTELARRLGVSKQAVGQLVGELVDMGALERVPDPKDGRAKLIRLPRLGAELLDGMAVLCEFESQLSDLVGADVIGQLRRNLLVLHDALESVDSDCHD